MGQDYRCRQILIGFGALFLIFLPVAFCLLSANIAQQKIKDQYNHNGQCLLRGCKIKDFVNCGCDDLKCDLCISYNLNFSLIPLCGPAEIALNWSQLLMFGPGNSFNCNSTYLPCYYSCPNVISSLSFHQLDSKSTLSIVGLSFAIVIYCLICLVLFFLLDPFRKNYQEIS